MRTNVYNKEKKEKDDKEEARILKLRADKESALKRFSPEVRKRVTLIIDELFCEIIFNIHRELKLGILDRRRYDCNYRPANLSPNLLNMAEHLNITKPTQKVDCPKCLVPVKCLLLTKHLALCINPSTYFFSSRNSSRVARQRIQEDFKNSIDKSIHYVEDEQVKSKKCKAQNRK